MKSKFAVLWALLLLASLANASGGAGIKPVLLQTGPDVCTSGGGVGMFGINAMVPWYCSQVNQVVYANFIKWLPLAFVTILFGFSLGTIIFITGIILRNAKIRNHGVAEIYEATATALIVVFFMMLCAVLFGFFPAITAGGIDPYNTSLTYINNTILATNGFVSALYYSVLLPSFYSSIRLEISSLRFASNIQNILAVAVMIFYVVPAETFAQLVFDGLLLLNVEYYLIMFGMIAGLPVFLLPGIVMRSIYPTRSLGSMFIAIAIAFYFVMPTLFAFAFSLTNHGLLQALTTGTQRINVLAGGTGSQSNAATAISPLPTELQSMQNAMGDYWLAVLFYPALILALTYFAIVTIADFIGGFANYTTKTLMSRT